MWSAGLTNPRLSEPEIKVKIIDFSKAIVPLWPFSFEMRRLRLLFVVLSFSIIGCTQSDLKEPVEYTGPLREAENVELYNSEDDQIKSKLTAALVYEFANGDREFPKGVYIEMYNEFGRLQSTLRADYAKFIKEEGHWRGQGNVEVKNIEKNEQLNTEELFWNPKTKKIFTDKFVTIRTQGDVLYGTGLNAMQDLTDYVILNPKGTIEVNE
jgi:LPS export ABC transporter protein LptC